MCRRSVAPADKPLQGILPERQSSSAIHQCHWSLHLCAEAQTREASAPCVSCDRVRAPPSPVLPAFLIRLAS